MTRPIFRLEAVTAGYPGNVVVRGVDLTLDDLTYVGIVGPSGAGKTTLLRVLLGVLEPLAGVVHRRPGLRLGYVAQVQSVDWTFPVTVEECVLMARTARRWWPVTTPTDRDEARRVLDRLGAGQLLDRHVRDLSGGEQQRVLLARSLLQRPDVLLLDEPTSGIDVRARIEVLDLLAELHRDGLSIVLTTHDLNGVAANLPTVVCLHESIVAVGAPSHVLTSETLHLTYGVAMEVVDHGGRPLCIDPPPGRPEHRTGSAG